ncbi:MAG TPA: CHAT domain-containing protein [Pyrinomonadaceae bacterium]|jgi:CHAT domain-containing protein/tetratricopeptide (TPR) repeat protein
MQHPVRHLSPSGHSYVFKLLSAVACAFFGLTAAAQEPQPDVRGLAVGERVVRKVVGTEFHVYTVRLRRGQVLRASIVEKGADVGVAVIRTTDNQTVSATLSFGYGFMRESLTFIPEQDGAYGLAIIAQQVTDANVEASYELTTSLSNTSTERDRRRLRAEKLLEEGMRLFTSNDRKRQLLAAAKWEASTALWRSLGEEYWAAIATANVGFAHVSTEEYVKAVPYLDAASAFFEGAQYVPAAGAVSKALGSLYLLMLDIEKGDAYLNKALKIARSLGDKRSETQIVMLLSVFSRGVPNGQANPTDEVPEVGARKDEIAELMNWVKDITNYTLDDSKGMGERRAFFARAAREALPLARGIGHKELETQFHLALGFGYIETARDSDDKAEKKADKAKSFDYLMQALWLSKVTRNKQAQALVYFGMNLFYEGDNDRLAILFGKKALNSTQDLRQYLKSGDKEVQQNYARRIEERYGMIAEDLFFEGRLAEAQQVINLSRDQEYFDFTRNRGQPVTHLALTAREVSNERILNREVGRVIAKYARRPGPDYTPATAKLKAAFRRLEKNFRAPASGQDINRNVPDTTDMQAALRQLDAKSGTRHVALYFVTSIDKLLLLTPDSIRSFGGERTPAEFSSPASKEQGPGSKEQAGESPFRLIGRGSDKLILEFLETLKSPGSDPRRLGSLIYKRIFKTRELVSGKVTATTLEAALARYKPQVLLWSLSGNLRYVPMAALYDEEKKQYLVEKYESAVFTRARKERFLVEPKPWEQNLAFGTSDARGSAPPLPGVAKELAAIFGNAADGRKGLLPGRVFLNDAFTRLAFLAAMQIKPSLIHIASHFSFQPGDSQNSYLLLGDGDRLSLSDMHQYPNLFEGVDLLTLSACETAAQQPGASGKEIDGFAELAQRMGASSVIATLWKVADDGTSRLTTEFYRLRPSRPGTPKSAILRQAQLNLLSGKDSAAEESQRRAVVVGTNDPKVKGPSTPPPSAPFAHPYYWAPFVLFGGTR